MKSVSFRTARRRLSKPVLQLGAGVLILGLAVSASAKDDSSSANTASKTAITSTDFKPAAKATSKTRHWFQVGMASWYGFQFQGRKTAGGESFDMNSMTCAHPTLPMGTWLRVTNLKNRKTTFVRVNDRGPLTEGRIIDLSFAAAQVLGMAGVANVKLEAMRESDPELARAMMAQVHFPLLPAMWIH